VVDYYEARRRDAALGGFSMQVEPGLFLCPDSHDEVSDIAVYMNHSCEPNVGIKNQISFVALRDIEPGEELTFDYAMNVAFAFRFNCSCSAPTCRGIVSGDDWRKPEIQEKYKGYFDAVITAYIDQEATHAPLMLIPEVMPTAGPVFNRIVAALSGFERFDYWRDGIIARNEYLDCIDMILELPPTVPLNENERALSSRLWWRPGDCVEGTLRELRDEGLLGGIEYDVRAFKRFAERVRRHWNHEDRWTYIFPEEAQLAFAIASCYEPKRLAVVGSYYGYWAAFALAGGARSLEQVILIDKDAEVCRIAQTNLSRLVQGVQWQVECIDAFEFFKRSGYGFDMVLLDAEGPRDSGDASFRGKAIYGPLLESMSQSFAMDRTCLVAHNILTSTDSTHPYFQRLIGRNRTELDPFMSLARELFNGVHVVTSTEGVGIYWR
jgi:predicted O-methyltransferase YrrM